MSAATRASRSWPATGERRGPRLRWGRSSRTRRQGRTSALRPDVAIVSPYPPRGVRRGGRTGVASYTAALAAALDSNGAKVVVVAPRDECGPARVEGGVRILPGYARGPRAVLAATASALGTGAPVVHLQHEMFAFGGAASVPALVPGLRRLRRAGRGPVVTLHQVVDPSSVD